MYLEESDQKKYIRVMEWHDTVLYNWEKSAISKVQKHIFCNFKNGNKKNQFLHQKKV